MKKSLIISLLSVALLWGGDHDLYPQSLAVTMGYTATSKESNIANSSVAGIRYNQNIYNASAWAIDAYQVAFDMNSDVEYLSSDEKTNIARLAANLIWTVDNQTNLTPFILLGAGVSYVSKSIDPQSSLSLFTNIGGGFEYNIRNDIALVSEVKYIYEDPNKKYFNTNVGLKFSFGD